MNWKFRLSLVLTAILVAIILLKLPSSKADTDTSDTTAAESLPITQGKITQYSNGVSKIEPLNFAVSGNVRDMPTIDPDALVNRASFMDAEKRREEKVDKQRAAKGLPALSEEEKEINERNAERVRKIIPGAGAGDDNFLDPLVGKQTTNMVESPQAMPTPSLTFDGASQTDNAAQGIGGVLPPDVNGDVGLNHYVSSVNLVYKIFKKDGTVAGGPIKTSALFAALPAGDPCRTLNDGDPIVMYDSLADRWHISQFAVPSPTNYQCVALSVTGDPTGAYYIWSYPYPGNVFNDYPKVGVWTDAYHMTFNQFNNAGDAYLGLGVLSQDRPKALAGDPNAGAIYLNIGAIDIRTGGALPGDIDGYVPPPPGMAEVIGEFRADEFGDPIDGIRFYKWVPNFTNPGSSTLTILPDLALAPFDAREPNSRNNIEVLGASSTQYLDSIADRSMHRFAYRNFGTPANPVNSYVGNFAVNVGGIAPTSASTYQTGIRWFEVRRTNDTFSVFDQGTQSSGPGNPSTGLNNWMGSIAQDNKGNIALGYSQAGTTQRADIKIAGRTNNVANSGTLNEGEALFFPSGGFQTSTSGRWGDYSAMNVDPSDDCTFWYTQEYYAATSSSGWSTRVGKFRYPSCTDAPKATITGTITNCATGAPVNRATVNASGGFNRLTIADGTYSMIVSPGTYSVTAGRLTGYTTSSAQNATVTNGQTATVNFCIAGFPVVSGSAPTITSESCGTANTTPDPGETLTVNLPLQNTGGITTSNLTATLLSTGGITALNNPQIYGALAPDSAAVTRSFNFRVDTNIACGSKVTLTFNIADGATNLGTVTKTYSTGVRSTTASFTENFDGVTAPALPVGWTNVQLNAATSNWITSTTTPSSAPNDAFGNETLTISAAALVSPPIAIQRTDARISFKNSYNTEADFDGMVLEFTTNNGTTWTDIITGGGAFVSGGYNRVITGVPIGERSAWSGNSGGYLDTVINLPASLAGQTVKFRWVIASDQSVSVSGVRIDNVQIFDASQCSACVAGACRIQRRNAFDADTKSDFSVFRKSNGIWFVQSSAINGYFGVPFGIGSDKLQPQDYDGDGKTDVAVVRNGDWYILKSSDNTVRSITWGFGSDIPVASDYTGDGKADIAVYRPSNGAWYILRSEDNSFYGKLWGGDATDIPVVGDFDGDCKSDLAVRRTVNQPSVGDTYFFIDGSTEGGMGILFGRSEMQLAMGDYNADGRTDVGVVYTVGDHYDWYIANVKPASFIVSGVAFGGPGDIPVPADYDGDGRAEFAIYRPGNGIWFTAPVTEPAPGRNFRSFQFGGDASDTPTPRWNQYPLP